MFVSLNSEKMRATFLKLIAAKEPFEIRDVKWPLDPKLFDDLNNVKGFTWTAKGSTIVFKPAFCD